jgi:hypothetical protein
MAAMRRLAPFAVLCALALLTLGACDRSPCEQTCRHVAACKREKQLGAPIAGESAPPADPTCMARCEAAKPEYASCEGKKRECSDVLACISY